MANDEIGNALHPVSAEKRFRDGMTLYAEIEACKQRRRFFGRGRVVTRWSVGRNTHQLAQKIDLFRMVRIDPAGELVVEIHGCASSWNRCAAERLRRALLRRECRGIEMLKEVQQHRGCYFGVVRSHRLVGMMAEPLLPQRTKSIAIGQIGGKTMASWPAPLARCRTAMPCSAIAFAS